jgi:hypothetical protein
VAGLSPINRGFNKVPKRAEGRVSAQLRDTFVDSGVATALESIDNQVLYGRRGTGKTHAFAYLAATRAEEGDIGIYIDLRTVGSAEGLFDGDRIPPLERTARLLIDLLTAMHDAILDVALDDNDLIEDAAFVGSLDNLVASLTNIRFEGEVATTTETETSSNKKGSAGLTASSSPTTVSASAGIEAAKAKREKESRTASGRERVSLNFGDIARSLRDIASGLRARRVWLLLDEWSSVPLDVQPYLAAFTVRCITPLQEFTVKIAAIEKQTRFRATVDDGQPIGIELGADFAANVDLDEFMVFEQDSDRSREFFRGLLFKHLTAGAEDKDRIVGLDHERDLIAKGFTGRPAFDELVRASEGVPRDAINIAAKAAVHAGEKPISTPHVRKAARQWFQSDKEAALKGVRGGTDLLNWVYDEVIRGKRARGFLVSQRFSSDPLLNALFDARVLHLARRGYSAQDAPGERYDVYLIDFGAYVDLINTQSAPQELTFLDIAGSHAVDPPQDADGSGSVDVPVQDLRALRRAILDLDAFYKANPALREHPQD